MLLSKVYYCLGFQLTSASQDSPGTQGGLAFVAVSMRLRSCMFLWWELSLVSLALPLLGTQHVLYLQENVPSGLFGSSVFD